MCDLWLDRKYDNIISMNINVNVNGGMGPQSGRAQVGQGLSGNLVMGDDMNVMTPQSGGLQRGQSYFGHLVGNNMNENGGMGVATSQQQVQVVVKDN